MIKYDGQVFINNFMSVLNKKYLICKYQKILWLLRHLHIFQSNMPIFGILRSQSGKIQISKSPRQNISKLGLNNSQMTSLHCCLSLIESTFFVCKILYITGVIKPSLALLYCDSLSWESVVYVMKKEVIMFNLCISIQ